MMWELTSSPTLAAALAPASTAALTLPTSPVAEDGDQTAADGNGLDQGDVGGLDHGVAGFDAADVALGFNHAYCFDSYFRFLLLS